MKFKIVNDSESECERTLRLYINGDQICVKDGDTEYVLAELTSDGILNLWDLVDNDFKLPTDRGGYIKVTRNG